MANRMASGIEKNDRTPLVVDANELFYEQQNYNGPISIILIFLTIQCGHQNSWQHTQRAFINRDRSQHVGSTPIFILTCNLLIILKLILLPEIVYRSNLPLRLNISYLFGIFHDFVLRLRITCSSHTTFRSIFFIQKI